MSNDWRNDPLLRRVISLVARRPTIEEMLKRSQIGSGLACDPHRSPDVDDE